MALSRATPRCANVPVQQFHTIPLWSRSSEISGGASPCPASRYAPPRNGLPAGRSEEMLSLEKVFPSSMGESGSQCIYSESRILPIERQLCPNRCSQSDWTVVATGLRISKLLG